MNPDGLELSLLTEIASTGEASLLVKSMTRVPDPEPDGIDRVPETLTLWTVEVELVVVVVLVAVLVVVVTVSVVV